MSDILKISDQSFDTDVLKSDQPVLVDFWAEWCPPCRAIAPILDEAAGEYSGRLKVAKVNVDEAQGVASTYKVRQIPTLMVFKNGEVADQHTGALSKSQLDAFLEKHL